MSNFLDLLILFIVLGLIYSLFSFNSEFKYESSNDDSYILELRKSISEREYALELHKMDYPEDERGIQQRIDYINHLKKKLEEYERSNS